MRTVKEGILNSTHTGRNAILMEKLVEFCKKYPHSFSVFNINSNGRNEVSIERAVHFDVYGRICINDDFKGDVDLCIQSKIPEWMKFGECFNVLFRVPGTDLFPASQYPLVAYALIIDIAESNRKNAIESFSINVSGFLKISNLKRKKLPDIEVKLYKSISKNLMLGGKNKYITLFNTDTDTASLKNITIKRTGPESPELRIFKGELGKWAYEMQKKDKDKKLSTSVIKNYISPEFKSLVIIFDKIPEIPVFLKD